MIALLTRSVFLHGGNSRPVVTSDERIEETLNHCNIHTNLLLLLLLFTLASWDCPNLHTWKG